MYYYRNNPVGVFFVLTAILGAMVYGMFGLNMDVSLFIGAVLTSIYFFITRRV